VASKFCRILAPTYFILTNSAAERYLEHAVNISVEQQHLDPLQAALTNPQRTPTAVSYRVPLAVSPASALNEEVFNPHRYPLFVFFCIIHSVLRIFLQLMFEQ
jgi:hypothetical protein